VLYVKIAESWCSGRLQEWCFGRRIIGDALGVSLEVLWAYRWRCFGRIVGDALGVSLKIGALEVDDRSCKTL
jgi:lambda repressor-like predicted transcriptional regulator